MNSILEILKPILIGNSIKVYHVCGPDDAVVVYFTDDSAWEKDANNNYIPKMLKIVDLTYKSNPEGWLTAVMENGWDVEIHFDSALGLVRNYLLIS